MARFFFLGLNKNKGIFRRVFSVYFTAKGSLFSYRNISLFVKFQKEAQILFTLNRERYEIDKNISKSLDEHKHRAIRSLSLSLALSLSLSLSFSLCEIVYPAFSL